MNEAEARALLRDHLQSYRGRTYAELVALIGQPQVAELRGDAGADYQVEVEVHWDDQRGGDIRVTGAIDDGGWRAFVPLCDSFIVCPDGKFVGE